MELELARVKQLVNIGVMDKPIYPIVTQTNLINAIDPNIQRYVIMPFHFLPGGLPQKYGMVVPNSMMSVGLVNMSIKMKSTYALGIALHTYADTWAHQGFTAFEEDCNKVISWETAYRAIVPNIGHADIGNLCDIVDESWQDYRLPKGKRRVINFDRFIDALKHCFIALKLANEGKLVTPGSVSFDEWEPIEDFWKDWLNIEDFNDRCDVISPAIPYHMDDHRFHDDGYEMFQYAAKKQIAAVFSNMNI